MPLSFGSVKPWIPQALVLIYSYGLLTSMATMEIASWSLFSLALGLILFARRSWPEGIWKGVRLGQGGILSPDAFAIVFLVSAIIGALIQDRSPWWQVAGEARWIFLLYSFALILRRLSLKVWLKGLNCFWWAITLAGAYSLWQFITGIELIHPQYDLMQSGPFWRSIGFFNMPLTFAAVIGMAASVAGTYFLLAPTRSKAIAAGFALVAGSIGVLTSLTRGVWAGLIVAIAFVTVSVRGRKAIFPLVLGAVILVLAASLNGSVRNRLIHTFNLSTTTYTDRFALWTVNWEIFKDHPIFGVGYGQSYLYVKEYYAKLEINAEFVSHAHNVYIQMLSATGVMGLLMFLALSIWFLKTAWHVWQSVPKVYWEVRSFAIGSLVALLALHVAGISESNFTDGEVNHITIFIWANLAVLHFRWRRGEFDLERT